MSFYSGFFFFFYQSEFIPNFSRIHLTLWGFLIDPFGTKWTVFWRIYWWARSIWVDGLNFKTYFNPTDIFKTLCSAVKSSHMLHICPQMKPFFFKARLSTSHFQSSHQMEVPLPLLLTWSTLSIYLSGLWWSSYAGCSLWWWTAPVNRLRREPAFW